MADEKRFSPPGFDKELAARPLESEKESSSPPYLEKEPIALEDGAAPPGQVLKHSHDADEAMKAFADGEIEVLDEATNRRLLRKIDLHIMPVRQLTI